MFIPRDHLLQRSSVGIVLLRERFFVFFGHVAPVKVKFDGEEQTFFLPNFILIGSGMWVYGPKP